MPKKIDPNGDTTVPTIALMIMGQMTNDAWATSQSFIDSLQWSNDKLEATLTLIRRRIYDLCEMPYSPNPLYIMEALRPDYQEIEKLAEKIKEEREGKNA